MGVFYFFEQAAETRKILTAKDAKIAKERPEQVFLLCDPLRPLRLKALLTMIVYDKVSPAGG